MQVKGDPIGGGGEVQVHGGSVDGGGVGQLKGDSIGEGDLPKNSFWRDFTIY